MNIPAHPSDLDINIKDDTWRPGQIEALSAITDDTHKIFIGEFPTGTGKSLLGLATARLFDIPAVYLTGTKQLQEQIKQMSKMNSWCQVLMGRNEYPCTRYRSTIYEQRTAEDCDSSENNKCFNFNKCLYKLAKRRALNAKVAVLNYSYFLHEVQYIGEFSRDNQLIISDECDLLEKELLSFVEVEVSAWTRAHYNITTQPEFKTKYTSWAKWSDEESIRLSKKLEEMKAAGYKNLRELREGKRLNTLVDNLSRLTQQLDESWIFGTRMGKHGEDWVFKPTWVQSFGQSLFLRHASRHLMMSATIGDARMFADTIGLKEEYKYISLPSPFPVENRPIYYWGLANLTHKTENSTDGSSEIDKIYPALRFLLEKYPDKHGLVHTISNVRTKLIQENVPSDRWVTPPPGADGRQIIEQFKTSLRPLVLLSPALERGLDLPYDSCRWLVICKISYPDLSDKQIARRLYGSRDGKRWYAWETARRIEQASGRGNRAIDDECDIWILDQQFEMFCSEPFNWKLFSPWWREAIKRYVPE